MPSSSATSGLPVHQTVPSVGAALPWAPPVRRNASLQQQIPFPPPGSSTNTSSYTNSLANLPPVPTKMFQAIKEGKYIDFDSLFSAICAGAEAVPEYEISLENSADGFGAPQVRVRQCAVAPRRIRSYAEWYRAWSEFSCLPHTFILT